MNAQTDLNAKTELNVKKELKVKHFNVNGHNIFDKSPWRIPQEHLHMKNLAKRM